MRGKIANFIYEQRTIATETAAMVSGEKQPRLKEQDLKKDSRKKG